MQTKKVLKDWATQPATPLVPMQDQFGQIVITPGFSKLEKIILDVSAAILAAHGAAQEPEAILLDVPKIVEIIADHYEKMSADLIPAVTSLHMKP